MNRVSDAVVDMSFFGPSAAAPSAMSTSRVAWSDVYVGIIGLRYGSPVRERPELSYTELEFEAATRAGLRRLIFLLDERSDDVPRSLGPPDLDARQARFRAHLLDAGVTITRVSSPAQLEVQLVQALYELPDLPTIARERDPDDLARVRRDLLLQVRELVGEQEESLDRLEPIELGLLEQRSAVARPRNRVLHRENEPDRTLPRDRPIRDVFRDLGGQLLILGEPGAGKTTLLYELASELLEVAVRDPGAPVPVVVHLSWWPAEGSPLDQWLVEELYRTYGLAHGLGAQWLAAGRLVPLLDGLDEVDPERRDSCVDEVNRFRDQHSRFPFAVCSRVTEYRRLRNRLVLHDAVLILPLERPEIEGYLERGGSALSGLREALRRDQTLWELLTTPLFLNLVAVTYRGRSREEIGEARTLQRLRGDVLADYVSRMLERVPATSAAGYGREDVARWLRWMASAMTSAAQSVFHLDLIQAGWLPFVTHRRLVTIGVPAALGLLAALFTGLVLALDTGRRLSAGFEAPYVLVFAAALGLGIAIVGYQPGIKPTVRLWWSRETCARSLRGLVRSASIATAVIAPAFGLVAALASWLGPGADLATPTPVMPAEEGLLVLVQVAAACAGVAAIVAVTAGIEERFAIEAPQPGHAMTTTRRNWLVGTFLFGLPAALVFLLASQVLGQWVAIGPRGTAGRISDAGPLLPLVLLEGAVAGLAVGPLVRLALPVEPGQRRLDGLLLAGVTAAVLGPAQFVLVRMFGVVGVPLRFWLAPGVPVWPFAGTVAGLIVVFGGSTRRGAIAAVIAAITAGTVFPHQGSIALFARFPSSIWLMWVVGIPMAVGLRLGGSAFLRHWTLRWLLARDGLLPWDCLPFLDHMTRLHLLRRRGGGYEFIHRLLQEHLRDERAG